MSDPNDINLHSVPCCGSCRYNTGYLDMPECTRHDMWTSAHLLCNQYEARPPEHTLDDTASALENRARRAEYKRLEELG